MLSIGRSLQATPVANGGWAELLDAEERHVSSQGFGAGILVINYGGKLLRHIDDDTRALTEAAVLAIIDRHLGWTDRTELIAAGRHGVLAVPIDDPLSLSRRARELHRDLRACGLDTPLARRASR